MRVAMSSLVLGGILFTTQMGTLAGGQDAVTVRPQAPRVNQTPTVSLTTLPRLWLIRQGYVERECVTHVNVTSEGAVAEFECEFRGSNRPLPLRARLSLTEDEIARLKSLFVAADLYGGRQAGCLGLGEDGPFETLKATADSLSTVVLVVTCNGSFEDETGRRYLLAFLRSFEARLRTIAMRR